MPPYVGYTLNLLNGSLLPQNVPSPACSLPTPAPYVVHIPEGPEAALALPALGELFVACPTGNLLVINGTTGALLARVVVGSRPVALLAQSLVGSDQVYVANAGSNNISIVSTATDRVVGTLTVPVGAVPSGLALGPQGTSLYVTERGSNSVSVFNTLTRTQGGSISVGTAPNGIAFDPFDGRLYVANSGSDTVSVIAPVTNTVVSVVGVGDAPAGVAISGVNGEVYVSNTNSSSVSVISAVNGSVVATVAVGPNPRGLAYSPSDQSIYVADEGGNSVSVIGDNGVVTRTIQVGVKPLGVTTSPSGIYSINSGSYNLSEIAPGSATVGATLTVATSPRGMAYDPSSDHLFVPLGGNDSVAVIDTLTNRMVATLRTGLEPALATYDPYNGLVYVDNHEEDSISVINGTTDTVERTFGVGQGPTSMVVDPVSQHLFVGIGHSRLVEVFNTSTYALLKSIPVGNTPYGMTYVPLDGGRVFVTNYRSGNLTVIDPATETVVGNYPIAANVTLMAYDASNEIVYISSFATGRLYEFNASTDTVVGSIAVGSSPMGVLAGGPGGLVYVVNYGSTNLTAIDPVTETAVGSVPVAAEPIAAALLPNGETYVTNAGASSISILLNNSLVGLRLSPRSSRVAPGASTPVVAIASCASGPCPSSVLFRWAISGTSGSLNRSTGSSVTFYAGATGGSANVTVRAVLGSVNRTAAVAIQVGSGPGPPTLFGLPASAAYAVIASGGIAAAAVVVAIVCVLRSRRGSG